MINIFRSYATLNSFSELWITFLNFGLMNYFYYVRSCGMESFRFVWLFFISLCFQYDNIMAWHFSADLCKTLKNQKSIWIHWKSECAWFRFWSFLHSFDGWVKSFSSRFFLSFIPLLWFLVPVWSCQFSLLPTFLLKFVALICHISMLVQVLLLRRQ